MAQTFTVKLSRFQSQPWGFRLQGGKDFSTALSISRIQPKSIADEVGLQPGDAILKINEVPIDGLRHKEAQDALVRAGNNFELTVQRGGVSTWKPSVTPLKQLKTGPKQDFSSDPMPVIKTSLAANKQDFVPAGSTHNLKAKPFSGEVNGSDTVTALVHKQYNSPMQLYSMQNIADTLSSQAEVLAGGVKGINFMKDDPPVNKESAVYKMVKEDDVPGAHKEPAAPRPMFGGPPSGFPPATGLRSVEAPQTLPSASISEGAPKPGDNVCHECGRLIVGVFVRIKDRSMHADCFKCNTCGQSLKNVGYYNINDKLYCDIHARQVARQNPPADNMSPVTVPPGAPLPNVPFMPHIQKPSMPSPKAAGTPGAYAPTPFHKPKEQAHISAPKSPSLPSLISDQPEPASILVPEGIAAHVSSILQPEPFSDPASNLQSNLELASDFTMPPAMEPTSDLAPAPCFTDMPALLLDPLPPINTSMVPQPTNLAPMSPGPSCWLPPRTPTPDFGAIPTQLTSYNFIALPPQLPTTNFGTIPPLPTTNFGALLPAFSSLPPLPDVMDAAANISATLEPLMPFDTPSSLYEQSAPKPAAPAPSMHSVAAPSANKPYGGTGSSFVTKAGSKFVWPPPKLPDDETLVETAPAPSAPSYRAPPSTQHTQYTPSVLKQSPTGPMSPSGGYGGPPVPLPKCASPTPFSAAAIAPIFKPVAPPAAAPSTPITPSWSAPPPPAPSMAPPAPAPAAPGGSGSSGSTRTAPKRGRGVMKSSVAPGTRIPICAVCGTPIRGPFVTALGKTWCPDHFICVNSSCRRPLQDVGFVEEQGQLYCELCYETYLAPVCSKCNTRVKGDCLNAIGKQWHPDCFLCAYCHTPFGNTHFYLEDGLPYCEKDWNELFTTKCVACGFPIEAGDRWVEALNSNYHTQCFKCSICNKNLEGQSFFAKGGRPFCKSHAR